MYVSLFDVFRKHSLRRERKKGQFWRLRRPLCVDPKAFFVYPNIYHLDLFILNFAEFPIFPIMYKRANCALIAESVFSDEG